MTTTTTVLICAICRCELRDAHHCALHLAEVHVPQAAGVVEVLESLEHGTGGPACAELLARIELDTARFLLRVVTLPRYQQYLWLLLDPHTRCVVPRRFSSDRERRVADAAVYLSSCLHWSPPGKVLVPEALIADALAARPRGGDKPPRVPVLGYRLPVPPPPVLGRPGRSRFDTDAQSFVVCA